MESAPFLGNDECLSNVKTKIVLPHYMTTLTACMKQWKLLLNINLSDS